MKFKDIKKEKIKKLLVEIIKDREDFYKDSPAVLKDWKILEDNVNNIVNQIIKSFKEIPNNSVNDHDIKSAINIALAAEISFNKFPKEKEEYFKNTFGGKLPEDSFTYLTSSREFDSEFSDRIFKYIEETAPIINEFFLKNYNLDLLKTTPLISRSVSNDWRWHEFKREDFKKLMDYIFEDRFFYYDEICDDEEERENVQLWVELEENEDRIVKYILRMAKQLEKSRITDMSFKYTVALAFMIEYVLKDNCTFKDIKNRYGKEAALDTRLLARLIMQDNEYGNIFGWFVEETKDSCGKYFFNEKGVDLYTRPPVIDQLNEKLLEIYPDPKSIDEEVLKEALQQIHNEIYVVKEDTDYPEE